MSQEQVRRPRVATQREQKQAQAMPKSSASSKELKAELDELLDEIDTVLEDETFATTYVQKGGE